MLSSNNKPFFCADVLKLMRGSQAWQSWQFTVVLDQLHWVSAIEPVASIGYEKGWYNQCQILSLWRPQSYSNRTEFSRNGGNASGSYLVKTFDHPFPDAYTWLSHNGTVLLVEYTNIVHYAFYYPLVSSNAIGIECRCTNFLKQWHCVPTLDYGIQSEKLYLNQKITTKLLLIL